MSVWRSITGFFELVLGLLLVLIIFLIPFVIMGIGIAIVALIVWWVLKLFGVIALVGMI
jgi:hypothetical protein